MSGQEAAGCVEALYVSAESGGPNQRVATVQAIAGQGLVGDRNFAADGDHDPLEDITLFSREDVDTARRQSGVGIDHTDLRRNVMTGGVDLPDLVGATVRIGEVVVDSLADNPPCSHLQQLAGKPLLKPLVGRGGLRGRIVRGGVIQEGDVIERLSDQAL